MPSTRATHLVWDWNGTLLADFAAVAEATRSLMREVGGPELTDDEQRRRFRRPIVDYYAELLEREIDEAEFASLDRRFHDHYDRHMAACGLDTEALAALAAWRGTQSLLSMWFHSRLVPLVDSMGLTEHFTHIDGLRGELVSKRPHLEAHLAAKGLDGSECVLIGDTVDDGRAAAGVGARAVLYAGGFADRPQLEGLGFPVVDSLTEAVAVASTFRHCGPRLAEDLRLAGIRPVSGQNQLDGGSPGDRDIGTAEPCSALRGCTASPARESPRNAPRPPGHSGDGTG
ncbi:haloacid dehalogenase-like hydrolase [Glycomyces sp. L485]|nr:HAD hydrolase-like protein [Glycomyces sp. L485]MCH7232763.1 haloacid dehalogenase-like hydrolase [Glycomyces sp. L485]